MPSLFLSFISIFRKEVFNFYSGLISKIKSMFLFFDFDFLILPENYFVIKGVVGEEEKLLKDPAYALPLSIQKKGEKRVRKIPGLGQ